MDGFEGRNLPLVRVEEANSSSWPFFYVNQMAMPQNEPTPPRSIIHEEASSSTELCYYIPPSDIPLDPGSPEMEPIPGPSTSTGPAVRYGRVPKRSRERTAEPAQRNLAQGDVPDELDLIMEMGNLVSEAHVTHCHFTDDLMHRLERRPVTIPSIAIISTPETIPQAASSTTDGIESQRIWLFEYLAEQMTPAVQRIVEFAKRIPGFIDLTQDDQLITMKLGFFEIWLSRAARHATESTLTFDDGTFVTRHQLEIIYDSTFASSLFRFVNNFNSVDLGESEVGLFVASVIMSPERPGLSDHMRIQTAQDRLLEALKLQALRNNQVLGGMGHSMLTSTNNMSAVATSLLLELRSLGARQAALIHWYRSNWMLLRLPPLFAEILDIPKIDEEQL